MLSTYETLGDFRFCFPFEPCSQELKARLAALNAVTGAQIRANLVHAAHEAEMARLEAIDQRVKAQMKAEAQGNGAVPICRALNDNLSAGGIRTVHR
jgi:hypothetical protein